MTVKNPLAHGPEELTELIRKIAIIHPDNFDHKAIEVLSVEHVSTLVGSNGKALYTIPKRLIVIGKNIREMYRIIQRSFLYSIPSDTAIIIRPSTSSLKGKTKPYIVMAKEKYRGKLQDKISSCLFVPLYPRWYKKYGTSAIWSLTVVDNDNICVNAFKPGSIVNLLTTEVLLARLQSLFIYRK